MDQCGQCYGFLVTLGEEQNMDWKQTSCTELTPCFLILLQNTNLLDIVGKQGFDNNDDDDKRLKVRRHDTDR